MYFFESYTLSFPWNCSPIIFIVTPVQPDLSLPLLSCNVLLETLINTELRRKSTNRRRALELPRSKLCLNVRSRLKVIYFPRLYVFCLCWCVKNTPVMIMRRLYLSGSGCGIGPCTGGPFQPFLSQFSHNLSFLLIQWNVRMTFCYIILFLRQGCHVHNYFHGISTGADNVFSVRCAFCICKYSESPVLARNLPFVGFISVLLFLLQNFPFFVFYEKDQNLV